MADRRERYANGAPRRDAEPWGGEGLATPDIALERASTALRRCRPFSDPLFPIALLRGKALLDEDPDATFLLEHWAPGVTRETGSVRYRWPINPMFAGRTPEWVGPSATWQPWWFRDVTAWADLDRRSTEDIERLLTPLILADSLDLLVDNCGREDSRGDLARVFLDEALRKARRDAAAWVLETRAWADTWALWAIARRPAALTLLYPFASAIADSYAASAAKTDGRVLGSRFPFHKEALVSASGQLAAGLVALGVQPNLAGSLTAWVHSQRHEVGGWGDADGSPDLLTTLVAAELLARLDPTYDLGPTAAWFASAQRPDGWWRACGPEATWLTVEILAWLQRADRPFAERFVWPHLAVTNRDRRTGLPFYGYFADLERLFDAIPGLSAASIDVAFIDLAGFGVFNNEFGMERGDDVLRTFAQALARIPGSMAMRDGGDEFIVLGSPSGIGLPQRMAAFRESWAAEFADTYGTGVVAPRVLTTTTTGAQIIEARNDLGRRIGQLKDHESAVGPLGIQVDLGQSMTSWTSPRICIP